VAKSSFVYVVYVASRADAVWRALLEREFTRQYWGGDNRSDWQPGSAWEQRTANAPQSAAVLGVVQESRPPHRLVLSWASPADAQDRDRHGRVTFEIEPVADMVRLTVTHDRLESGSDMQGKVCEGWPRVLSSLKPLLETGQAFDTWAGPGYADCIKQPEIAP
jgi:uncharacterized protein YndB with AHSA1/START domain